MPGETAEMSLKDQLVEARKRNEAGAEKGLASVEGIRSKTREFIKAKINQFRKWDHDTSVKLLGGIGALPEQGKIVVQAGINEIGKGINAGKEAVVSAVESGKKFVIDKKDALVERGREVGRWFEARGNDIENFAETTKDKVVDSVTEGIRKIDQTRIETRDKIINSYKETKLTLGNEVIKGKNKLVKAWGFVEAIPNEIKRNIAEEKEVKAHFEAQKWRTIAENASKERSTNVEEIKRKRNPIQEALRTTA